MSPLASHAERGEEAKTSVHLKLKQVTDGVAEPTVEEKEPGSSKEKDNDVVTVCEYRLKGAVDEAPKIGCVYQNAGSVEALSDARVRLELFSMHVLGKNLTDDNGVYEVAYRKYNLSDDGDVTALRDLYRAERLLSLSKDFPPSPQRLEVEQDPTKTAEDKSKAKFIETMLTQHAKRIALMNQDNPSDEERREVAAIDLFLSAKRSFNPQSGSGSDKSLRELYGHSRHAKPEEQRALLKELLVWFREEFPYYYSGCLQCDTTDSNAGGYIGCVYPSREERSDRAGVCELYVCKECQGVTRFPRYHSMRKVLTTRRGRCGEYSILIMRILEQLGYESRYVVDWEDHVWAEARLGTIWTHIDSCEASIDEPLLYNSWGKKQTHIYSFKPHRPAPLSLRQQVPLLNPVGEEGRRGGEAVVEDVTRRYTPEEQWEEALARRAKEGIDDACVKEAVHKAALLISNGVPHED